MRKILAMIFIALLLAGCAGGETPVSTTNPSVTTNAPTEPMVEETTGPEWAWLQEEPTGPEATKAVLELTEESLAEYLNYHLQLNRNSDAAYMDAIAAARSLVVTSFVQTDDVVTAQVTVTVPDVYAIITSMDLSAYTTAEETDAALCSAIENAEIRENQVTVTFTAGPNRWIPQLDDASTDACFGGLLTYLGETTEGAE